MKVKPLFILLILIVFPFNIQSQIIKDLISNHNIDFSPRSRIDYISLAISMDGKKYNVKITYNDNLQPIRKETYEDDVLTFRLSKEYDSLNRIIKERKRVKNFFGLEESFKVFSWNDINAEVSEYDNNNKMISKSTIEIDSLKNPIKIASFDSSNNLIGKESAKYDYDNNLMEIYSYDRKGKIFGITVMNIYEKNMKISFDDYFKKTNYESIKSLCKNWEQLEIVFFDRKYKIDKDGIWKNCIFQKVNYSPLTKKYRITFNDKTSRKIVYKK